MDKNTQYLNDKLEILTKIQKLNWLMKECIGMGEYELCAQIRDILKREYNKLDSIEEQAHLHNTTNNKDTNE